MAYVINGGDRASSRFQDFVDLCCEAFNIIRRNSFVLINLLSLVRFELISKFIKIEINHRCLIVGFLS